MTRQGRRTSACLEAITYVHHRVGSWRLSVVAHSAYVAATLREFTR